MFKRLLIANRGEIAIRIARTAADLNIASVMIYSQDDAASLHMRLGDEALALTGEGPAAYLDGPQILRLALEAGCEAIHPGYGFLSENSAFARLCNNAGVAFVGPSPEALVLFGDKVQARALAKRVGAPVLPGSIGAATLEEAERFFSGLSAGSAVMLKAVAGGGGRGMRAVHALADMAAAYERCRSEALQAFGMVNCMPSRSCRARGMSKCKSWATARKWRTCGTVNAARSVNVKNSSSPHPRRG